MNTWTERFFQSIRIDTQNEVLNNNEKRLINMIVESNGDGSIMESLCVVVATSSQG